jgi:glycosyltransferase involved in cell wall biosynthesis
VKRTICLAIPTYNREEILVKTLEHALKLKPAPNEILVVDQTPEHTKTTTRFLERVGKKKSIRLIKLQPPSLTAARNRAIAETKSDIIIFIDDDVELPKDFVEKHSRNYSDDKVQAVAGGVDQEKKPAFPPPPPGGKWPRLLDYKYFSVYAQKRTEGVANFMGCNHSVRVETLRRLGGYDTHYIGSAVREDTDMAVRIWKKGGVIIFDPEARLKHLAAPTGGCRIVVPRKTNPEWWVAFNRNYFAFRHLFPSFEFWRMLLFKDLRESVFRKSNVFNPWRIPWAFLSYGYSVGRAAIVTSRKRVEEAEAQK